MGVEEVYDMYLTGYRLTLTNPESGKKTEFHYRTFKALTDELAEMSFGKGTMGEVTREYRTHRGLTDGEHDLLRALLRGRGATD